MAPRDRRLASKKGKGGRPVVPATTPRHRTPQRIPKELEREWWQHWWTPLAAIGLVAVAVLLILAVSHRGSASPKPAASASPSPSAQATPLATPLAGLDSATTGQTIDGIQCQSSEQVLFHIHAHLAIYVNGQARSIPEGIGIPPPRQEEQSSEGPFVVAGKCYYWLHSHTDDGIIHIESPVQRTYTLGNWFDIWGQTLSDTQVGPATGTVIAYVNGQRYTGDVRSIPLNVHTLVQLDVGQDVQPQPFTFPSGL